MPDRSRWRRFVEALLPWYSPEEEARRNAHTQEIRRNAIAARLNAEKVRRDYALMDARLRGKR
jgi:hypothetical protein